MFTKSEPYNHALELAINNDHVINILGEPIETDGLTSGSISLNGDEGEANFKIPIEGPNGQARIDIVATKSYGKWTYEKLLVLIKDTHEEINLQTDNIEENQ
jgi:hypothetical protein